MPLAKEEQLPGLMMLYALRTAVDQLRRGLCRKSQTGTQPSVSWAIPNSLSAWWGMMPTTSLPASVRLWPGLLRTPASHPTRQATFSHQLPACVHLTGQPTVYSRLKRWHIVAGSRLT